MSSRAVFAGATRVIGSNLAEHPVSKGFELYGVARKLQSASPAFGPSQPIC